MRCSTCGETLEEGAARCATCGAVPRQRPVPATTSGRVKRCPRCEYVGEGVPYFSRTGHVGLLMGVSVFTYGLGGLAYWLARRKHLICPSCGLGWEHASPAGEGERRGAFPSSGSNGTKKLPSSGVKRRVLGSLLVLLGSFLIMMGIIELEMALVVLGSVAGAGGSGTFFWGWKALQERRQAVTTGLQQKVLRLATRKGGTLTVTDVAAELDLSMPAAEKILIGMDGGFRVRSEITEEGIILYEFPEVQHRGRLESGSSSGA